jgi:DNA-binding CsgD family transcriptional regulator
MTKQEILSLEKEYKHREFVEQLKHSREKMGMFTIIIVLLGVVAIALLLWNRKRILLKNKQIQEESLKFELEARNRELASNVVSLMKKNEVFSEIINKLEQIKENAVKDETKEALAKVKKEIEKTIDGSFWDEFELRFKNVHSDFYDKLISQFPNLTSNELRLCAFLKMNLSTKDIASITGQNPRSIDKARERLRTKLGISNDKTVSLASFIQRI